MHRLSHDLYIELNATEDEAVKAELTARIDEAKSVIEKISKLKYEMGRDHALSPIPADGEPADEYNLELNRLAQRSQNTWFTAPWLFAECYLYRLLRSFLLQTSHWRSFDPFFSQKIDTFKQSGKAIHQIATTMHELEEEKDRLQSDPSKLAVLFKEMIQMCLWGNATDLSLLTHLSASDIEHLQSVGKDAQAARQEFILRDNQEAVWEQVKSLHQARVDFVLDNAGFELFTDLVFADFLVTYTPYVSKVIFHPKLIPWFVSDVTPPDFSETITSLLDPGFLASIESSNPERVRNLVLRWQKYIADGTFSLSVPETTPLGGGVSGDMAAFWTSPWPYWDMETRAPNLYAKLKDSGLVIFKGDLNYRKLTGDIKWPAWTAFSDAVGPLAGSFPLLSLRTNKADVVVGVDREIAEKLDAEGNKWRVDGRYALISFIPNK
ncbi:unnamed protein product [Mycena citricolor]|uniref:Sugar phosphate phosphatase n=1 Tax=Mycena citricolor TaxID=2018698 RepID=A0AAD2HBK9_9AGAR|nr:unnamed protein product [Mycena citricolor]